MLKNKNALITGSTSGIGEGIARALAKEGCNIVLNGFGDAKQIEQMRSSFEKDYGVRCLYSDADLTVPVAIETMISRSQEALGQLDIVINNAGIQYVSPIESFPTDKWDKIIALNLTAAFHTTRLVMTGMKQRGYGRIINIASVHGLVGSVHKSAYVAAKHGIIGLTKVTGLELAGSGVTANAICPGYVMTPLVQAQIDAKAKEKNCSVEQAQKDFLIEKQPSNQFATVDQLGALAVFLCGEHAAQMTGSSYVMDGGWTAQ